MERHLVSLLTPIRMSISPSVSLSVCRPGARDASGRESQVGCGMSGGRRVPKSCCSGVAEDGGSEGGCCLGLHAGQDVFVDIHGERDAGVAEAFADDFGVDALLQQDRGAGVAQVV